MVVDNPDLTGPHLVARFWQTKGSSVYFWGETASVRTQFHWHEGIETVAKVRGAGPKPREMENVVLTAEAYTSLGPFLSLGILDLGDVISQFVRSAKECVVQIADGKRSSKE